MENAVHGILIYLLYIGRSAILNDNARGGVLLFMTRFLSVLLCVTALACAWPSHAQDDAQAPGPAPITDEAERIYGAYGDAVYQVQVIDLASEKKSEIGSGFQFTADGFMATNYHVVAEAIQKPENNRLEYLHEKGGKGTLKVLVADVVHDLAILRMDNPGKTFVELGKSSLPKGTRLFSMGNPHDIGFTITEGIHNGQSNESFIDKIHFSGAINAGMSGGPALSHDGRVVGINVMTAGNQIGFLVPVEHLRTLMTNYLTQPEGYDFVKNSAQYIETQLLESQQANLDTLLKKADWEKQPFGLIEAPGRLHPAFKCWGAPRQQDKDPYTHHISACYSQDRLFLEDEFETGAYQYRYDYIAGKKELALPRFYTLYENIYADMGQAYNAVEGDVTNFECNNDFVDLSGRRWKTSFCVRQYKKYPKLYDMHLYMAMVGEGKKGQLVTLSAQGVSKENALAFARRFMDEITPVEKPATETPAVDKKDIKPDIQPAPAAQGEAQGEAP